MFNNNNLSLALIHPHYRHDGGAERLIYDIIKILRERDIKITLYTRNWQNENTYGLNIIKCDPFYIGRVWRDLSFYKQVSKLINNNNFDVIQSQIHLPNCNIYYAGGGVHREWLNQRDKISSVPRKIMTNLSLFHNQKKYLEKKTFQNKSLLKVVCNSEMVKKDIAKYFHISENKITIVHPGINEHKFNLENTVRYRRVIRKSLNISDDKIVYIFVGSGFERKGLATLLECLGQLPTDSELLVIGKDKKEKKYQKLAKKFHISKRVHFLGLKKDVVPYYAASDIFVLPSLYDAFGLVILEAMFCGLPVVASNTCGAAHDFIINAKNGYKVDPLDKTLLFDYMYKLRDPKLRKQISNIGKESVNHLNLDNMSNKLMRLYAELLKPV